ncbi:prepilin-type N-terminal cleavage/methylation domain-containing protein [Thermoanaerobacterium sp. RBIITD]|uniref:competence type IV pilus major pilin ComGC n=1 Tax=Thermoanaerobacterium sp. RBIITD TaxID=1550240 RepID=UPI000BB86DF7|nr:prepilin-type N-terminal cleavage/methylation domain-containing protein [Thermoanaerobacterium sp. RBIITD]SNX55341.1 type IV pilus assembly protein PilA [Thermoanaerobacterium sp. RBIITD]
MAWFVKTLNKDEKGFTLVELIVVIAILGILAAIAVPRITGSISTARKNADIANAQIIGQAAERYMAEKGVNEVPNNNINQLVVDGYLNKVPKTSANGDFTLITSNGQATVKIGETEYYPTPPSN